MNHQSSFSLRSFFQPVDLTQGTCWKTLLVFAFPIIVSYLLQQVYSISDAAIVGQTLTASEVAGVNDTTSLAMIFLQFAFGASAGFCTVTSCFVGARDSAGVRRSMATQIVLSAVLTAVLTALALALLDPMLAWINVTPASREVYRAAYTYCAILFGGIGAQLFYNFICSFLRSMGDSATPLAFLLFSTILNVGLDLLFILSFHWGVAGAAIATDISQLVSCVLSLRFLMNVDADYKVELSAIRPDQRMTSRIIRIGLPTGIQNMVISFSNVLVQSSVNSYGAAAMAGFAAYMKIDGFNILPVTSFSMAATTFVGQNYGAGNLKRVKNGMWVTLGMGVLYTLCTGALLLAFQNPIMHLFTSDETVVAFGCSAMHYFCPFYFLLAILHGMAGAVRGTGRSVPPMVVLLISLCLFRVVWIQFALPFFAGIEGVFVLYPVSWALGAVLMALYAWKGSWMTYEHS